LKQLVTKHVPEEAWVDFIEDRLSATASKEIHAHLQSNCTECVRQFVFWKRFLSALERSQESVPPASFLQNAFNLFEEAAPRPSFWQQVVASLVMDSRQTPLLAGARAATDHSFNLVFATSEKSISLWCETDTRQWKITGQVLPPDTFWSVIATNGSMESRTALEDGEFRIQDLTSGLYDLTIRGTEGEILLGGVDLTMP